MSVFRRNHCARHSKPLKSTFTLRISPRKGKNGTSMDQSQYKERF